MQLYDQVWGNKISYDLADDVFNILKSRVVHYHNGHLDNVQEYEEVVLNVLVRLLCRAASTGPPNWFRINCFPYSSKNVLPYVNMYYATTSSVIIALQRVRTKPGMRQMLSDKSWQVRFTLYFDGR